MSNFKSESKILNLKIVFLGTPSFVQPIRDTLAKNFTLVDSPKDADLGVVAAYGKILTAKELQAPKYGFINIHPSLLPKYRGPTPIQQAILNGDKISGISIIQMDEEVDHGPIIYQEELELSDSDNFDTLSKKMFLRASKILPHAIKDFLSGKINPQRQNHPKGTSCPLLTRQSGYFDINDPPVPAQLDRMIRAYYPWPGVWTKWKGKIVKFLPLIRHPGSLSCHPERSEGSLTNVRISNKLRDSSSKTPQNDKFLIQMEGKNAMPMQDFLNGYPDFPLKEL